MVSVGDSGHGVDLEVLVRTDLRDSLDGAPVGEGGLSIVEPVVAEVLHVVVVKVSNTLGNLAAGDSAADREDLVADLLHDLRWGLTSHQLVVELVATTEDLDVIEVMRIDGGKANTAVVHLAGEDLITEEVVSENTAV